MLFIKNKKNKMGIFNRKSTTPVQKEERSMSLGGLLFNQVSSYSSKRALRLSAVYSASDQISNAVACLPIDVVKYDSDEKRPAQGKEDVWRLLNLSPDGLYTHMNVFKMATESLLLEGNAFFYIERDANLNPVGLKYINAEYVTPIYVEGKGIKYLVNGAKSAIPSSDMIHLWQHIDETYRGISVLKYARNVLEGAADADKTANKFYKGGAGLNGVLTMNQPLDNEQKKQIRQSWNEAFSSEGNGVAVLPKGMEYKPVSVNPEDAQLLETRQFSIREIARFFNISPIKLYELDEVSYSSMESTELYFYQNTILPICKIFEEEFNRKLFKPSEVGTFGISFNFARALKTNRKDEAEYYRTMFLNGFMSLNEVRGELALPKLEGDIGDNHFIQLSYNTIENIVSGKVNVGNSQKYNQEPTQTKVKKEE